MSRWMLCPAAHEYARTKGVVVRCGRDPRHHCNGERTPYFWDATVEIDGKSYSWRSEQACCGSCQADAEYGYPYTGDACCCAHSGELDARILASGGTR